MKKIIAISGHARSGKDHLCNLLCEHFERQNIRPRRFAFADVLKDEVDGFLKETTGISAWTSNEYEKSVIRPFLVFWGTEFRRAHDPKHWIKSLANSAKWKEYDSYDVAIITDLRFPNELQWLRTEVNAKTKTIHLTRIQSSGILVDAPNEYERENNIILREHADIHYSWPTFTTKVDCQNHFNQKLIPQL